MGRVDLQETKVTNIHKALGELDPPSWNTFMSEIQAAFQRITGKTITTSVLDEVFWKVLGRRKRATRAGAVLKKIGRGGPRYVCPWDRQDVSASMRATHTVRIKDPNEHCNIAIQLDCGHWLLDDCDPKSRLNGTVLNIKDKRQVHGETTGVKKLIQERKK